MDATASATQIGNKEYMIPEKESEIWDIFNETYEELISENLGMREAFNFARFQLLIIYPNISNRVVARVCKSGRHVKLLNDYDYIVEFSGEIWDKLSKESKKLVMLHELRHVHIDYDRNGEPRYRLINHDVQDFYSILDKYGLDYIKELRQTAVSLNGKEPKFKEKDTDSQRRAKIAKTKEQNEVFARSIKL